MPPVYPPTYPATYGDAFPLSTLDLQAELQLNGTWTPVTPYIYSERALPAITRGRPDETSQAVASSFTAQLDNRDNRFSTHNPLGAYYPYLTRNTPFRVHVPDASTYLRFEDDATSYVGCNDAPALSPAGDLEARIDVNLSDWSPSVLAGKWKFQNTPGDWSWTWLLNADGTLTFAFSLDGSAILKATSTVPLPWPGGRISLKVTYTSATGTARFYYATAIGGTYHQIGVGVTPGSSGAIFASDSALIVGWSSYWAGLTGFSTGPTYAAAPWLPAAYGGVNGRIYEFQFRSGIGGTLVANPVFSSQTTGPVSFTDAQGNLWGGNGTAAITNRKFRFHGELGELPPRWDPSGVDVYVGVQANGLLRRIGQQQATIDSALTRAWSTKTGKYAPVAYWPCEDGNGAVGVTTNSAKAAPTQIASGLRNGQPMTLTSRATTWASNTDFLCTQALPAPGQSTWSGFIPSYKLPSSNPANVVRFLLSVPSGGDTDTAILMRLYTKGTVAQYDLQYGTVNGGSLQVVGYDTDGNQLFASGYIQFNLNGNPCMAELALTASGGTVACHINTLNLGAQFQLGGGSNTSGSIGVATHIIVAPTNANVQSAIGQIAVQSSYDQMDLAGSADTIIGPFNAWAGEPAGVRFVRLCTEQGYNSHIIGYPATTVAMGAQSVATFSSLLQEIEDADHGMVYEPRTALSLGYRTSASLCNQGTGTSGRLPLVLSYTAADLGGGGGMAMDPTDDDLLTLNDIIVTRGGGAYTGSNTEVAMGVDEYAASAAMSTQAPPAGVGTYQASKTANVLADSQLGDQGGWIVHRGTCAELRYPSIPVDLARSQLASLGDAIQELDLGDMLQVSSPPQWLAPDNITAILWGLTETLGGYIHTISHQTTPESIYETLVAGTGAGSDCRADAEGSTVSVSFSTSATSLSIASPPGSVLWTTVAGDFPFDIVIAGERMTVTNITGTSSPQTFTVTRSVNGIVKAHIAGETVSLFAPCYGALV